MSNGMAEALRRRQEMVRLWAEAGHPETSCVGHEYPLPNCPKPEVHRDPPRP